MGYHMSGSDPVAAAEALLAEAAGLTSNSDEEGENAEIQVDITAPGLGDVWQKHSNSFHPANVSLNMDELPPGVYVFQSNMRGWWLEMTSKCFEFPFKLYGSHDHITERIKVAWGHVSSNLGVLLNGVKGTGKTVSAQQIGNWAIEQGIPVLLVGGPIPLGTVLSKVQQDMVVIFDEFEKTHARTEHQQALLTTLDGMGRSRFKRLFLLTTNNKKIEDNFIDRPSRIRYSWEFGRLSDDVIEEIMDDLLDKDLTKYRSNIVTYLNTRKVLSIDVVKTVITEVNIFREAPEVFNGIMNLSEQVPRGFQLTILTPDGEEGKIFAYHFGAHKSHIPLIQGICTKSGAKDYADEYLAYGNYHTFRDRLGGKSWSPIRPTDIPDVWLCNLYVPLRDTWMDKFPKLKQEHWEEGVWLDKKPEGWKVPAWATKLEKGIELSEEEEEAMHTFFNSCSAYGTSDKAIVPLKIEAKYDSPISSGGSWFR